jgi:anthraniloyl-CoA monooxygenase
VNLLGGGPGGLYAGLLLKKAHPAWDIVVSERNPAGATYGWGVVFSDQTLAALREADYKTYTEITDSFVTWDAIDVYVKDRLVRCGGHGFAGIARRHLLKILQDRCAELGVDLRFQVEIDDLDELAQGGLLIAADGVNSKTRARYARFFQPRLEEGKTRYIWFGTDKIFDAFTFIFRENEHGLFTVHAYPFDGTTGTFIVECAEETWRRAGLHEADEAASLAYCEALYADHLRGRRLLSNYSRWLNFITVKNRNWYYDNIVLLGDAAHTAHFSIGSGTKLAMEDSIALANAFERYDRMEAALKEFALARQPKVETFQRAAKESQHYFEHIKRYRHFDPLQFTFHLLTRSGRISYDNLKLRDPYFVSDVDRWFVGSSQGEDARKAPLVVAAPALFTPLKLRDSTLPNRIVLAAAPTYSAQDGVPGEQHAAQLTRRALGGAGLVVTEPVAVSAEGRITPACAGLYCSEHMAAWARAVELIHRHSPARIALNLSHAGRRGATRPRTRGLDMPLRDGGWPLLSASTIPFGPASRVPKAMECADMELIRDQFVQATRMADEAGFDMIQLNIAHGYLLASFLSPLTNRREDAYGGALGNRMRFPLAVFDAVRAAWPPEKPVAVAINATDWVKDGSEIDDAIAVARTLKEHGCDLVAVYAGQMTMHAQPIYDAGAFAQYSDLVRNEARVRTMATGYITTSDQANMLLAGGRADLCIMNPPNLFDRRD